MPNQEFYVLLPDPVHGGVSVAPDERLAESLWNTWTLAWHPSILTHCQSIPRVVTPDLLGDLPSGALVLVADRFDAGYERTREELRERGVTVVTVAESRDHPEALFRQLEMALPVIEHLSSVALDFYALGYAALQIDTLSRRLHFSNHCDSTVLQERCLRAAARALEHSRDELHESIQSCFDALRDQRHQFYPVDIHLLDWSLVPPDLSATSIRQEQPTTLKRNLWCGGRQLQRMDAATRALLQGAIAEGHCSPCGWEVEEWALPLWPADVAVEELRRGIALTEQYFGKSPRVFARRRFGLSGRLPHLFNNLGFDGAVHATLDAGQFPRAPQPRTQWFGFGGAAIDAIAAMPLDRRRPSTLLQFARYLGDSIDRHYVATICLAGWFGEPNPWYDDLRRACQWSPVLGTFETWETYLVRTSPMGQHADFGAGEYRSPYLTESIQRGDDHPLMRWVEAWSRWRCLEGAQAWSTWSAMVAPESMPLVQQLHDAITRERDHVVRRVDHAERFALELADPTSEHVAPEVDAAFRPILEQVFPNQHNDRPVRGTLILNPSMAPRRLVVHGCRSPQAPNPDGIPLAPRRETDTEWIVDVPSAGYRWIPSDAVTVLAHGTAEPWPVRSKNRTGTTAQEWELQNEFVRVRIDPESGGLAGFYSRAERPNRLSQRLYLVRDDDRSVGIHDGTSHDPARDETGEACRMVAESLTIDHPSPAFASLVTTGRLERGDGTPWLQFRQRFVLASGMRHVTLEVDIQLLTEIAGDPWKNYVASRVAWRSADARISSIVQEMITPNSADRFDSPLGFEIQHGEERTWVQSLGRPYHRRIGDRQCDTLMIVPGEKACSFRIRFCLDPTRPLADAVDALAPPLCLPAHAPAQEQGWLVFADGSQVMWSCWRPVVEGETACGFRVRLWESGGQLTKTTLRAARPIRFAQKCDFLGVERSVCPIEDGNVRVTLTPFEWTDLECRW